MLSKIAYAIIFASILVGSPRSGRRCNSFEILETNKTLRHASVPQHCFSTKWLLVVSTQDYLTKNNKNSPIVLSVFLYWYILLWRRNIKKWRRNSVTLLNCHFCIVEGSKLQTKNQKLKLVCVAADSIDCFLNLMHSWWGACMLTLETCSGNESYEFDLKCFALW